MVSEISNPGLTVRNGLSQGISNPWLRLCVIPHPMTRTPPFDSRSTCVLKLRHF